MAVLLLTFKGNEKNKLLKIFPRTSELNTGTNKKKNLQYIQLLFKRDFFLLKTVKYYFFIQLN